MIGFKDFKEHTSRKYVCLNLSDKSQKDLRHWAQSKGFDLSKDYDGKTIAPEKFDFHVTVYFTTNEIYYKDATIQITPTELKILGFDLFGQNKDTPVAKLLAQHLLQYRDMFKSQGFKDFYPTWKPHVSLSYNWKGTPDIKNLEYDGPPLFVDSIRIEPLSI